ncbi:MAG: AmmeMemoRadiSam system protein B [Blastocatellia bacterium]
MSEKLPRLRHVLDVFPSPVADQPGLLLRDPFRYAEEILIIPPLFVNGLRLLDGKHTEAEMQEYLARELGRPFPIHPLREFIEVLSENGFLETVEFHARRDRKHAEFAAQPFRLPAHAGAAYPETDKTLRAKFDEYLWTVIPPKPDPIIGIAAPHVSPEGGWECYAAAYNRLRGMKEQIRGKTIVILGTSHYGEPETFGLTRKPFQTPLGTVETDTAMVDWLVKRAPQSIRMEDYCHVVEHSIEFQVVFLQQMLGHDFKILPVLCGGFWKTFETGQAPETQDQLRAFFDALGELGEQRGDSLFWVLGIDLAHIGRRYGDPLDAAAESGFMLEVHHADEHRLEHVCDNNKEAFLDMVLPENDPLKWCGFTPVYTFMQCVPHARGKVLKYDQWNIDEHSVVSFTAMEFA